MNQSQSAHTKTVFTLLNPCTLTRKFGLFVCADPTLNYTIRMTTYTMKKVPVCLCLSAG